MKTLILMRHSKAEPYGYDDDYNRALTDKGKSDAQKAGEALAQRNIIPDTFVVSSAKRTRQTAKGVIKALELSYGELATETDVLYECGSSDVFLSEIQKINKPVNTAMIVAHNPSVHYICQMLCNEKILSFPTSQFAVVEFDTEDWADIEFGKGSMIEVVNPKQ